MFTNRRLYHLSHIDLDGYSCQLLSSYIFKERLYFNSNYGKEIITRVDEIFEDIQKQDRTKKIFILLTDLNLTESEAEYIENIKQSSPYDIHLQLLDHHITGLEVSEEYKWYHLNDKKSATMITFEFLKKNFGFPEDKLEKIEKFVNSVNALDIWLQDEKDDFEYGKVMMRLISSAREVNKLMFQDVDNEYKRAILKDAMEILSNDSIKEEKSIYLDDQIHFLKKSFFREERENNTFDNLLTDYIVSLLEKEKDKLTVKYKGYKGLLTAMLGNTSIIGNGFLMKNSDYDFFIDVSGKGNTSLRANGGVNVSIMAKELFNGGGHVNASGGRIRNFKENFSYIKTKNAVQSLFIEKEYVASLLPRKK
jgi:oligoribonuclease NrnB/cAMP/cGMP phosphodiesterase (DHH superfamily)